MKTKLLLFAFAIALVSTFSYAQPTFWGTYPGYNILNKTGLGPGDDGGIFKTDSTGKHVSTEFKFSALKGSNPQYTKLCEANNGKLYGRTVDGGNMNTGVIFEFDPATGIYVVKFEFTPDLGTRPSGSLIKATNGLLYGLTCYGGSASSGVLFEYNPYTNIYTKKFDFSNIYGSNPYGSLTEANNGKLYGMTSSGGISYGVIFEFDPKSGVLLKKVNFNGYGNGSYPYGDLTKAPNGKLYGMTSAGGLYGFGTIIEYSAGTDTIIKQLDFNNTTKGGMPYGSLMVSSSGELFGMTSSGGIDSAGVVFKFDLDSVVVKFNLDSAFQGYAPYGNLMQDASGRIYGMTSAGGADSVGTIFEFLPTTNNCIVKAAFTNVSGGGTNPYGTLMQAKNNKIYGLTSNGGAAGYGGILFEYDTTAHSIIKKIDINFNNGSRPTSSLLKANNGMFYGTTQSGGKYDFGVIFEYDPLTRKYTKLDDFNDITNGSFSGGLMQASNGNLYGMTAMGGDTACGVLYEFNMISRKLIKLRNFGSSTGSNPKGKLIEGASGKLYGMTSTGGKYGNGVIFSYVISSNTYKVQRNFNYAIQGGSPQGSLVKAANGNFYGMTRNGGASGYGTLFEYIPSTDSCYAKANFNGISNGAEPLGSLIEASDGFLYGLTNMGGTNGIGTLFCYNFDTIAVKVNFNGTNGVYPKGDLMQASNLKLYGLTSMGGSKGNGVLFEYNIGLNSFSITTNFDVAFKENVSSLIESGCYAANYTTTGIICKGETYNFGGQILTVAGTYTKTFKSSSGCDSIVTLKLKVECPSKTEFWGVTLAGGANNLGTIYKVDEKGGNYSRQYSFVTGVTGNSPYGGIFQASNGKLYGMTTLGGSSNYGVIYEFNPVLKTYTVKFSFNGAANGANPKGEFVEVNGILYGITEKGGTKDAGVLFEFNLATSVFVKKIDFDSIPTGANPIGSLILANNGLLYGVTKLGGTSNNGVIFEYNPTSNVITKKHDFYGGSMSGSQPSAGLMQANNGLLYGVTSKGGMNNFGMFYEYNPITYQCSTKHEFYTPSTDGAYPQGKLVQANNGLLYGTTETGGFKNSGVVFSYDFYTNMFYAKASFDSTLNGKKPLAGLAQSPTGNLLGTTSMGGNQNKGVIFEFNTFADTLANRHTFAGIEGASPLFGTLIKVNKYPIYDTITTAICQGQSYSVGTNNYTSSGTSTTVLKAVNGVDSIVVLYLTVNPTFNFTKTDSFCQGSTYTFGTQNLTAAGNYTEVFTSKTGCDSTIVLTLKMNPIYNLTQSKSICQGDTLKFGTKNLTAAGTYTEVFKTMAGCDSTIVLTLTVNPTYNQTQSKSICQGDTYKLGTQNLTTAGVFTEVFKTKTGCDSTIVLTLTVNPVYTLAKKDSICKGSSYILGSQTLTKAGVYTEIFKSKTGCDSTVTLTLKVDSLPLKPAQAIGTVLVDNTVGTSSYSVTPVANALSYTWSLLPAQAGVITGTGTTALVTWSQTFSGQAKIEVKGVNNCGSGVFSDVLLVTVTDNPVAQFSYVVTNFDVTFTNASINGGGYNWDFGDGRISKLVNPTHTYAVDGYYTVCLKVINVLTNQTADTCIEIKVGSPETACKAKFTYTITNNKITLTNTSTGIYTDVFWDYGDGKYSTQDELEHTYAKPNYYEITLTIFNSETNCLNTITKVVKVLFNNVPLCNAKFNYFVNDSLLSLTNASSGDITDYFWDFGDGTYSFEENPEHVFTESGYFDVNLTIYSIIDQCIDEQSAIVFIYNAEVAACNAKFSYYPNKSSVTFTSEATGDYKQNFWDFNDGTNSNVKNPVHTFAKPGYYEVSYTVINKTNGCFDTQYKTIFVEGTGGGTTSDEIKANYSYVPNSKTNEVKFKDESKGTVTTWYWNLGDNSVALTDTNPKHVYATNDYYRVCLTASNSKNQQTNCKFIAVGDVSKSSTSYYTYFADSVTATGYFKNKSLGNIVEYHWDFGDGNESTQKDPSHTYADTGYYAVCLTTKSATEVEKTYCNDVRIGNAISNPCLFSCVWPGDANNDLEANHYDIMTIGLNYNLKGPKRENATTKWYGQFAQNWSTYQWDGTNNKYGDANGDGAINFDDVDAIKQNFAISHYETPDVKGAEWQLACVWDTVSSKRAGSRGKATAQLSPPFKGKAGEIYAIGYEIEVIGGEKIKWDSVTVNFDNSWIGVDGVSMLTVTNIDSIKHIIYIGMTRIDQQNISGSGKIAEISIKFKDDVDETGVSFNVTTKGGIEATGETTSIDGSIELALKSPIQICEGESALIDAGSGFETYTWSNSAPDTSRIEVSEAGIYIVTVTNSNGATAFDTVEIIVNEVPTVDLGADITQNGSVELDAGAGFNSYLWSNGSEEQTITVSESGEYSVEVTNELGCLGADTINITITDINYDLSKQLSVYPNPNNGKFWLVYDYNSTASNSVEIINTEGKTVWHNEFKESSNQKNKIEIDNLENGVYYLKVIQENQVGIVRFVVL